MKTDLQQRLRDNEISDIKREFYKDFDEVYFEVESISKAEKEDVVEDIEFHITNPAKLCIEILEDLEIQIKHAVELLEQMNEELRNGSTAS